MNNFFDPGEGDEQIDNFEIDWEEVVSEGDYFADEAIDDLE